jgi:hypothetical protein
MCAVLSIPQVPARIFRSLTLYCTFHRSLVSLRWFQCNLALFLLENTQLVLVTLICFIIPLPCVRHAFPACQLRRSNLPLRLIGFTISSSSNFKHLTLDGTSVPDISQYIHKHKELLSRFLCYNSVDIFIPTSLQSNN